MVLLASNYDKSKYLKADDLEGERKFRIKTVTEEVIGVGADKEKKLVVWFTNDDRGLVLNRTNNRVLRGAFGDDTAGWAGKVIVAFSMLVEMRGNPVQGLRVRIPPPKHGNAAAKPSQPSGNGHSAAVKPKAVDDEIENDVKAAAPAQSIADDLDDEIPF